MRNPFFTDLAYQVEKAAAAHDLAVIMGNADEHAPAQDRYLQALARHRVDGIIAVPQGGKTLTLQRVAETVPLVLLDRDPEVRPRREVAPPAVVRHRGDSPIAVDVDGHGAGTVPVPPAKAALAAFFDLSFPAGRRSACPAVHIARSNARRTTGRDGRSRRRA